MRMRSWMIGLALLAAADAALAWRERARLHSAGEAGLIDRPMVEFSTLERARRIVVREKPQSKVLFSNEDGDAMSVVVAPGTPIRETVLEREASGPWRVANCLGLEADPAWLGQTMRDLSQGRLVRPLTDDPKLMADLGLDAAQVRFEDENGRVIRQLDFGRKDGGDYQFVRVDGGGAFLASHSAELVGDPLAWIVNRVLDFDASDVREFDLPFRQSGEPPLPLRRSARGAPLQPLSGTMPAAAAAVAEKALARLLASPVMQVLAPGAPAARSAQDNIVARARLALFDGRVFHLAFGVPRTGDPAFEGNSPGTLALAFYECSDPGAIAAKYAARAVLVYSRASAVGPLPENRAAFLAPAAP